MDQKIQLRNLSLFSGTFQETWLKKKKILPKCKPTQQTHQNKQSAEQNISLN